MLQVQVNYWNLQESIRHNKATEDQARNELAESKRHNIVTETETQRHNLATELVAQQTLQETVRHNVQTENVAWYNATTQRNLADSQIALNASTIALNQERASSERLNRQYTQSYLMPESSARTANLQAQSKATIANAKINAASGLGSLISSTSESINSILGRGGSSIKAASDATNLIAKSLSFI